MNLHLKISLQRIFLILVLFNLCVFVAYAQNQTDIPAASFPEWFRNHIALIGLIISEAIAILPGKAAGILQSTWLILQELFKKKST